MSEVSESAAPWAQHRAQIPALQQWTYMNCGWQGPLSRRVADPMHAFLEQETWGSPTARESLDRRMALGDRFRAVTAQMIGADADEIAIMQNTTEGLNIVVGGLTFGPGDQMVTTTLEHSSGLIPSYAVRDRTGAQLEMVPLAAADSSGEMLERFAAAITDRTKLVLLSEIIYSTGQLLPLANIVQLAHRHGAAVLVDGAQTAGHVPIDVHASGVDYYAIPSHKWLCGPGGMGALYVRRDLIPSLESPKLGGRAAASYDHEGNWVPAHEQITKFELTTISGPALAGAVSATEQYLDLGPRAVWDRVRELNRYAEQRFARIPRVTVTSPQREETRTGLFSFALAGEEPAKVSAYLQQQARVVCRYVSEIGAVRLSLHCYNTEADIDLAAAAIEQASRDGLPSEVAAATPWERAAQERT